MIVHCYCGCLCINLYPATLLNSFIRYSIFLVSDRLNYQHNWEYKMDNIVLIMFDCYFVCMLFYGSLLLPSSFLSLWWTGSSLRWILLLWSRGCIVAHGLWSAQASVVVACGLVNPRHMGSSQTRCRTHIPCVGRRILNHWTTREVPVCVFKDTFSTKLFLKAPLTIFLILFT